MLPKESPCSPKREAGVCTINGTGLSSTLLSSQRTTTHRKTVAMLGAVPPGHSFNITRSSRPCQPVHPGWCRLVLVPPSTRAHSIAAIRESKDLVGRPLCSSSKGPARSPVSLPARKTLQAGVLAFRTGCHYPASPQVSGGAKGRPKPARAGVAGDTGGRFGAPRTTG